MAKRPTLHEAVRRAAFATNVEVIDVPIQGSPLCLLRTTELPEFAFAMAAVQSPGAHCQMALKMPNSERSGLYAVICACCPSERHGLRPPANATTKQRKAWEEELAREFKTAIASACRANGIIVLFVRRAPSWPIRYGRLDGITIHEAKSHQEAVIKHYPFEVVQRALRFIDYLASRGLKQFAPPLTLTSD
ncbi:MAG: hypothetical protein UY23_C0006G0045 [Candidatus Jorgensenbacteria bacterium GW2011_GWA1_48_11]|uniref:Uncharacterized protein n=1 Tax=Candidatus Jorgensenbacteria bacterium GW2011_GWA1_48_11 TaxID=1618660 RepID=A0A0G1U9K9_9BACT|nr:MAG: hypothetical protein UY23_C0006G0045 [Candidatus Jorgensenbacteria bacterium GW2011_GWA1_48_11]KKW12385.1 MAG: hypothetical protein UY51_C0005G0627 [Candidatus Jorgensenbacteria bacterium GW2011_GWB1_49_9]